MNTYYEMNYINRAKQIFEEEIDALSKISSRLGTEFQEVLDMIIACKGKVVVMGVGKTGIIGHKISASLASTGTTSIFVHASEAMHGDLGMINPEDVALLISNSGSSNEIVQIIPPVKRIGCKIIAMTGNLHSALAKDSDLVLDVNIDKEACPLGLAPTTSTTATLVMGDALTICLMEMRKFRSENYALYHPGGALGRQLLCRVKDQMTTVIPKVKQDSLFMDVISEVSNKRLGMTLVTDNNNQVCGLITDGDIRRAIAKFDDIKQKTAGEFMTRTFKSIEKDALLTEALELMDANDITTLAVKEKNDSEQIVGIISIHHIIDFK